MLARVLVFGERVALLEQLQMYNNTSDNLVTISRQVQNLAAIGNRNVDTFQQILAAIAAGQP